jgi:hypothetical protein
MSREAEERQQLGQIALQLPHHGAIVILPAAAKITKGSYGLAPGVGTVDRLPPRFTSS